MEGGGTPFALRTVSAINCLSTELYSFCLDQVYSNVGLILKPKIWTQKGTLLNAAISFYRGQMMCFKWQVDKLWGGRVLSFKHLTKATKQCCCWSDIKTVIAPFLTPAHLYDMEDYTSWTHSHTFVPLQHTHRHTHSYGCLDTFHPLMPSCCVVKSLSHTKNFFNYSHLNSGRNESTDIIVLGPKRSWGGHEPSSVDQEY